MVQMNEAAAASLTPSRATELTRVLELQSEWENLAADHVHSTARLQAVQKAFDAYRTRMLAYTARDRTQPVPELTLNKSSRLGAW